MTNELHKLTIHEALTGLRKKDFSVTELIQKHLEQIEKHSKLNAYITLTAESALEKAKQADNQQKDEIRSSKLFGIPIAIKDNYCTKGVKTTAGSNMLKDFIPTYESTITQKITDHGAISLGKVNCDEFAMGSSNTTSYFGPTINPWRSKLEPNEELVPGGSSGGSAAAVAGFMAMGALGTDTGGSIRQPAAFTGLFGIKPTYGLCSRYGIIAFASSLDQGGIFARNVLDGALMLESIIGYDHKDSTSLDMQNRDLVSSCKQSINGLKIGIPFNLMQDENLSDDIKKLCETTIKYLKSEGAEIVDVKLPNINHSLAVYYVIASAEASSNLSRYDGVRYGLRVPGNNLEQMYINTRSEGFGEEVRRRIMLGTYVLSNNTMEAYYVKAQKIRRIILNDFKNAFQDVQAILLPTTPSPAFSIINQPQDPVNMYYNDIFTIPASLAGLPVSSVPAALSREGLPLGIQVIGNHFDESNVISISAAIERCCNIKFIPEGF